MTEQELMEDAKQLSKLEEHRFMVMVGGTIVISLVLVAISMWLYDFSGTEQLDLSRPGYQSVSEQVVKDAEFEIFNSNGPIDDSVTKEFLRQYDENAKKLTSVDAFADGPMTDQALRLNDPLQ